MEGKALETEVTIIGGGFTGVAIARELSRYKVDVILVERSGELAAGASKATLGHIYTGLNMVGSMILKSVVLPPGTPLTIENVHDTKALVNQWNEEGFHEWRQILVDLGVEHKDTHLLIVGKNKAHAEDFKKYIMLGKMAGGIADDALSTFLLAVTTPVMVCPAMNTNMLLHPATQRNLETLKRDGLTILETGVGEMACGATGPGRYPEPEYILDRLKALLAPKDFEGKTVLVSAGPTREFIDPVRFISNPSSGKMGYAVARAAEQRGARVILVSGPTALAPPYHVETLAVDSAEQMAEAMFDHMDQADVIIKTAAVGDYRAKAVAGHKIKREKEGDLVLDLTQNQDILKELGSRKTRQFLVGFAAETQELAANAGKKLQKKNLDIIVGNLVGGTDSGFAADTNRVTLFFRDGSNESLPILSKDEVAHILLDRIKDKLGN